MSDPDRYFHQTWLGMVQPTEGLVVSIPALMEADATERRPLEEHHDFVARLEGEGAQRRLRQPNDVLDETLGLKGVLLRGDQIPDALSLYVAEEGETFRPTAALPIPAFLRDEDPDLPAPSPAIEAGRGVRLLIVELPDAPGSREDTDDDTGALSASRPPLAGSEFPSATNALERDQAFGDVLAFDAPESVTGSWRYPPAKKLERLLRETRVPIGVLVHRRALRLLYAPHGAAAGHIDFRFADMADVGGRPILDALVLLLHRRRLFEVPPDRQLHAILARSRQMQAEVTTALSDQVFFALETLLRGFEAADARVGGTWLRPVMERSGATGAPFPTDDTAHRGGGDRGLGDGGSENRGSPQRDWLFDALLTVLLRMVFLLYAEDSGLLPTEHPLFRDHYALYALYARLERERTLHPESMSRRYGAWPALLALFRVVYLGASHDTLKLPPREGHLFDPNRFPFLEGFEVDTRAVPLAGEDAPAREAAQVPTVDDETVYRVLHSLIVLGGARLSYRALEVEQIGSVYEGLMGFATERVVAPSVRLRPSDSKHAPVWVSTSELLAVPKSQRAKWLKAHAGLRGKRAKELCADMAALEKQAAAGDIEGATFEQRAFERLQQERVRTKKSLRALERDSDDTGHHVARLGRIVIQPGEERKRTSSHYTPPELSGPIVARALEPLLACFGGAPTSAQILSLKVCDPAMGSGAFLVEACRYLGEQLHQAWLRERAEAVAGGAASSSASMANAAAPSMANAAAPWSVGAAKPLSAEAGPLAAEAGPLAAEAEPLAAEAKPLAAEAKPLAAEAGPLAAEAEPLAAEAEPLLAAEPMPKPGTLPPPAAFFDQSSDEDLAIYARRQVAERCLYGVDKNPVAVELAKLSLWLVTLQRSKPFTFLDHALRCGDALVGCSLDQILDFHWDSRPRKPKPGEQLGLFDRELHIALGEALRARDAIAEASLYDTAEANRDMRTAMRDADDALSRLRVIGDLLVGAFFAETKGKAREQERKRRQGLIEAWLLDPDIIGVPPQLRQLASDTRRRLRPFHWMLEFPEVFWAGRVDPLTGERGNEPAFLDALIGNPPFAGKNTLADQYIGAPIGDWLKAIHPGSHGNADLCAHFFRRAGDLLGDHGTFGLVATNTISQGDTRATGLQTLLETGAIYDARDSIPWEGGDAAVTVSTVHFGRGQPLTHTTPSLDERAVPTINSRLRPTPERADPVKLATNAELSFQGTIVLGMGFTLTPEERDVLVDKDPRNAERIFPYLGGAEVNTSPTHDHHRYVISFGQMSLEEAEAWPDLMDIVRREVKPERDKNKRDVRRKYWWRFGEAAPALYAAIAPLDRCLVNSQVSKHLLFAFQATNRVFANTLYAYPLDTHAAFATLQSRIHEHWARLLASSMKTDLRYSASDCFETFPFPQPSPRAAIPALEAIGQELYQARAALMVESQLGLTKTYNALKDPEVTPRTALPKKDDRRAMGDYGARIASLRALHLQMDRAVLQAYAEHTGDPTWTAIEVPPFTTPTTAAEEVLQQTYEDHILDHLFALNTTRSHQ